MKIRHIIIGIIGSVAVFTGHAQTVDDIISKNIDALGGKDKINAVKTLYIESTVDVMGNQAPSTTYIVSGKGYKNMLDFNGQQIIQCLTDKGGWSLNPLMGQMKPEAIPADQIKSAQSHLDIGGPLLDYAAKGNKVELVGKENVNGAPANRIKVTTRDDVQMTVFVDSASSYIVKLVTSMSMGGQQTETTIEFSNYKKTDFGFVYPYSQQLTLPQVTLNITHSKVEVNKPIDPSIFDMPK